MRSAEKWTPAIRCMLVWYFVLMASLGIGGECNTDMPSLECAEYYKAASIELAMPSVPCRAKTVAQADPLQKLDITVIVLVTFLAIPALHEPPHFRKYLRIRTRPPDNFCIKKA